MKIKMLEDCGVDMFSKEADELETRLFKKDEVYEVSSVGYVTSFKGERIPHFETVDQNFRFILTPGTFVEEKEPKKIKKVGYISTQGVGCFLNALFQNKVATSYETELDLFKAIPDLCEHALSNLNIVSVGEVPYIYSIDVERVSKFHEPIHYMATIRVQFKPIEEV